MAFKVMNQFAFKHAPIVRYRIFMVMTKLVDSFDVVMMTESLQHNPVTASRKTVGMREVKNIAHEIRQITPKRPSYRLTSKMTRGVFAFLGGFTHADKE